MTTTDLRALLGDRYDETRRVALSALLTAELHGDPGDGVVDLLIDCGPRSDYVLAAVLPDLLAAAWDEGHAAGWDDCQVRLDVPDLTNTPNPYRTDERNETMTDLTPERLALIREALDSDKHPLITMDAADVRALLDAAARECAERLASLRNARAES